MYKSFSQAVEEHEFYFRSPSLPRSVLFDKFADDRGPARGGKPLQPRWPFAASNSSQGDFSRVAKWSTSAPSHSIASEEHSNLQLPFLNSDPTPKFEFSLAEELQALGLSKMAAVDQQPRSKVARQLAAEMLEVKLQEEHSASQYLSEERAARDYADALSKASSDRVRAEAQHGRQLLWELSEYRREAEERIAEVWTRAIKSHDTSAEFSKIEDEGDASWCSSPSLVELAELRTTAKVEVAALEAAAARAAKGCSEARVAREEAEANCGKYLEELRASLKHSEAELAAHATALKREARMLLLESEAVDTQAKNEEPCTASLSRRHRPSSEATFALTISPEATFSTTTAFAFEDLVSPTRLDPPSPPAALAEGTALLAASALRSTTQVFQGNPIAEAAGDSAIQLPADSTWLPAPMPAVSSALESLKLGGPIAVQACRDAR
eukprot:TRINITY_DN9807_c0_g1_i1.p1 TRINITY_DN9807_c0_g1~~TRINITY_DN9807_c0_g1_i1.p1  ORF type:complete len:440 (+),score=95.64 TRINITY_DN9807_c0_g1_i1:115-1434(+)